MITNAQVIADSLSPDGKRLTTLQVCFPRFILAEVNTHRVLSRNYRSSRAVPVAKLLEEVRTSPFIPSQFTRNQAGMQGGEALTGDELAAARSAWVGAARIAADNAELLARLKVHKQYANRGLEPYLYVHGVISATEWTNLFDLRCHRDAQPEFQELAYAIRAARDASTPVPRPYGEPHEPWDDDCWHLPYVTNSERARFPIGDLLKMSAARCAWVSYKPYDEGEASDFEKVERTLAKLMSTPMHASPFEHVATTLGLHVPGYSIPSNFRGWVQWRHILEADRG